MPRSPLLDNNVPELDGIIPRGGDISSGQYTGMWHFINAKSERLELL